MSEWFHAAIQDGLCLVGDVGVLNADASQLETLASSLSTSMRQRGLRTAKELAETKPHGIRIKYMAGCRCDDCRRANTQYEIARSQARKAGDWDGLVDAQRARAHIAMLSAAGVGRRSVSDVSGVSVSVINAIRNGKKVQLRASTEKRILSVSEAAVADGSLVSAGPTWIRIGQLLKWGFNKAKLARMLGYSNGALQLSKKTVTVRNEYEVERLYDKLRCVPAKSSLELLGALKDEGFRTSRINQEIAKVAESLGIATPDMTIHMGSWIGARAAKVLEEVHLRLTE